MEDDQKKKIKKKIFSQFLLNLGAMEDDLKKIRNGRRPQKKMEDDLKKNKK